MMETREPDRYLAILGAAARGPVRLTKIARATGIPVQSIPKYLQTLISMGLVERVRPVKSRRSLYRVADPFHRFWLRHIMPRRNLVELGMGREAARAAAREAGGTVAQTWEAEAARHALKTIAARDTVCEAGPWVHGGNRPCRPGKAERVARGGQVASLTRREVEKIAWKLGETAERHKHLSYAEPRIIIYAAEAPKPGPEGVELVTLEDMARQALQTPVHSLPGE